MDSPDSMFSKGGLVVYLHAADSLGSGYWSHAPRVPVYFGDHPRPVYVDCEALRCPSCGVFHTPPGDRPVKWLAANKALNGGLCESCDK